MALIIIHTLAMHTFLASSSISSLKTQTQYILHSATRMILFLKNNQPLTERFDGSPACRTKSIFLSIVYKTFYILSLYSSLAPILTALSQKPCCTPQQGLASLLHPSLSLLHGPYFQGQQHEDTKEVPTGVKGLSGSKDCLGK